VAGGFTPVESIPWATVFMWNGTAFAYHADGNSGTARRMEPVRRCVGDARRQSAIDGVEPQTACGGDAAARDTGPASLCSRLLN